MASEAPDPRRKIPQIERLVREIEADADGLPRPVVVDAARTVVEAARRRARRAKALPTEAEIIAAARDELARRRRRLLHPVVNATGVVIHTNLGRAPLARRAIDAVARAAAGYTNLEYDLESGRRGDRFVHVEPMLALATGAEAALVVNNNAAAVLLVCAALARDREVIVSRGELIEIGGEFRIPEVLAGSGAVLREVGTTNRTHLRDYERAIGERTALVLKVHPSNYRVVGFTKDVDAGELAALTRRHKIPLVYDAGSGLLARPFADEPVTGDVLDAGADLVCFSGDKLLGGPQAGIVCGRAALISELRTHPLLRALRPDKLQLAALGETVAAYLEGTADELPLWGMIDAAYGQLERRAKRLARHAREHGFEASVVAGESVTGGGSLPGHTIRSPLLRLTHPDHTPSALVARLRSHDPPVVARVEQRALVCDVRTVLPSQDRELRRALADATGPGPVSLGGGHSPCPPPNPSPRTNTVFGSKPQDGKAR